MDLLGDHRALSDPLYCHWPQIWPWPAHWLAELTSDLPHHHELSWKFELFVKPDPGLWVCCAHLTQVLWDCTVAGKTPAPVAVGLPLAPSFPSLREQMAPTALWQCFIMFMFITQMLSWMKSYIRKNYFWHSWLTGIKPQSIPLSSRPQPLKNEL